MKILNRIKAMGALALALPQLAAAQCFITGFEGADPTRNGAYLVRQPTFSGSTAALLDPTLNVARATSEQAHTGTKSLLVQWKFNTVVSTPRWLRLTTFNAPFFPNPTVEAAASVSFWIYVPSGVPYFYVTLGARESFTSASCGGNGGTSGAIEWVGATAVRGTTGRAPIGKLASARDQWVQMQFDLPCELVRSFNLGNGVLNGQNVVFEHLAFTPVDDSEIGPYSVYLDDFDVQLLAQPTTTCPNDITVLYDPTTCGATVSYVAPEAPAGCPAAAVFQTEGLPSGASFPVGTTVNTFLLIDGIGRAAQCSFNVTVVDTQPPTITCPADMAVPATDPSGAVVSFAPSASDDCFYTLVCSPESGSTFPIGASSVTCAATDASGSTASCGFTIYVKGAAAQISELFALVQSLALKPSAANSLLAKLHDASTLLSGGDVAGTCQELSEFIGQVTALARRGQMTQAQAELLINEATRIKAVLGC